MALIYWGVLEDFPEKLVERATLSLVGLDMVICEVHWRGAEVAVAVIISGVVLGVVLGCDGHWAY